MKDVTTDEAKHKLLASSVVANDDHIQFRDCTP